MSEADDRARPAGRNNGLPAGRWSAVADLDPRIADDLLISLHIAGIAARIEPTPAKSGGYRELKLPDRPTDRLLVDTDRETAARELIDNELAGTGTTGRLHPEPVDGPLDPFESFTWRAAEPTIEEAEATPGHDPATEDHYEPPPAPPLPKLRPITIGSLALIILGVVIVVTGVDGGSFGLLGVLAILGGIGSLIWHMKDGPPRDSGWDDGAVL